MRKIYRIKNNNGDFVDIKKVKQDKKDGSHILEFPPSDGEENLLIISNQMRIPDSLNLYRKSKKGKETLKEFLS